MSESSYNTHSMKRKTWADHIMEDDDDDDDAAGEDNNGYVPGGSQDAETSPATSRSNLDNASDSRYADQIETLERSISKLNEVINRLTGSSTHSAPAHEPDTQYQPPLHARPAESDEDSNHPLDEDDLELTLTDEDLKDKKDTMFFLRSQKPLRIDYVLSYTIKKESKADKAKEKAQGESSKEKSRRVFEKNLRSAGLKLEHEGPEGSVDGVTCFVKIHATWDALATTAELMNMQKRIIMPKTMDKGHDGISCTCCSCLDVGEPIVYGEEDYFTATFSEDTINLMARDPENYKGLRFDIDFNNKEAFFTNAERSLIAKEILDRTQYQDEPEMKFGIHKLLSRGVYNSAYPLHEGPYINKDDPNPFEGLVDKDRQRLYEAWARPGRWYCHQPLDLIRKYFGEKVGIYFAWLGFYTMMLIPASIVGVGAFLYGVSTMLDDTPSGDICDDDIGGNITMCPQCDLRCDYWKLEESCIYAHISYVFDNAATVAFAGFMAVWSMFFLEFWKRKQKALQYDWDVANFELEERMRPQFEHEVSTKRQNPVTSLMEPFVPWTTAIPRTMTSFFTILFFICLVLAAIFGVIVYRIIIVALLYYSNEEAVHSIAKIITSLTAAVINFIVIIILNMIYTKVAHFLTEFEYPRTDTEFEDSFTFKMFLFQFVNFYGTIFYIAFFKGSFATRPADKSGYFLGEYRSDECDPSGCIVDLFIQLAIVMSGKQVLNNAKEIMLPKMKTWWRTRTSKKLEKKKDNVYMRWEQDNDLEPLSPLGLFDEYLEMVIQYGFVTLFVAAFPLAPLLALLNNIIEIRLDAYKFVCVNQRSPALKAQDIGIWYNILEGISFIAVLTNACIIGWTSDFIPKTVWRFGYSDDMNLDNYLDSSLSIFNVSDFNETDKTGPSAETRDGSSIANVTTCRYRGYYTPPDAEKPYEFTLQYWHILAARLAFVVVFEHAVFVITWFVAFVIPDVPSEVKQLQLYERALVKKAQFDATFSDLKRKSTGGTASYSGEDDETTSVYTRRSSAATSRTSSYR